MPPWAYHEARPYRLEAETLMLPSMPLTIDLDDRADTTSVCDVCPHPWAEHDALGVRYCTATTVSALPRGCICP